MSINNDYNTALKIYIFKSTIFTMALLYIAIGQSS